MIPPPEAKEREKVQEQKIIAMEQRHHALERALEDLRLSREQDLRRLKEKMEEEKQLQHEEFERAMESKLKE